MCSGKKELTSAGVPAFQKAAQNLHLLSYQHLFHIKSVSPWDSMSCHSFFFFVHRFVVSIPLLFCFVVSTRPWCNISSYACAYLCASLPWIRSQRDVSSRSLQQLRCFVFLKIYMLVPRALLLRIPFVSSVSFVTISRHRGQLKESQQIEVAPNSEQTVSRTC